MSLSLTVSNIFEVLFVKDSLRILPFHKTMCSIKKKQQCRFLLSHCNEATKLHFDLSDSNSLGIFKQ